MKYSKSTHKVEYKKIIKLGIEKAKKGNFDESITIFLKAIDHNSKNNEAYLNLVNVYILKKENIKAIELLKEYTLSNKYDISILKHHWKISLTLNLENDFFIFLKKLENYDNEKFDNRYYLYYLIAKNYIKNQNTEQAINYLEKSINLNKNYNESFYDLCEYLERVNKIKYLEKALKSYKNINLDTNKQNYFECLLKNRKNNYFESEELLIHSDLEIKFKDDKKFYLKVLDLKLKNNQKLNNYEIVLKTIEKRNFFLKNLVEYKNIKKENLPVIINHYKKVFNQNNYHTKFKKLENLNTKKFKIAFLVGFPRSGTTLLDTILMTNKNNIILEEKPYLRIIRDKFYSKNNNNLYSILNITKDEIIELRNFYLQLLNQDIPYKNQLIIDKLPLTITELGFVKIIFPEAKIITALRHPCDVILSCYSTYFKPNQAMINFLNLDDAISFYDNVFSLFEFYENEIGFNNIIIKYENVIGNFEIEIKKLFNYLEISYNKEVKNFFLKAQDRGLISTPSYSQVSNPIYKSSVGKWKNYEKYLKLEGRLKKWIKKFGYK